MDVLQTPQELKATARGNMVEYKIGSRSDRAESAADIAGGVTSGL